LTDLLNNFSFLEFLESLKSAVVLEEGREAVEQPGLQVGVDPAGTANGYGRKINLKKRILTFLFTFN
jgi:hypothetical protein